MIQKVNAENDYSTVNGGLLGHGNRRQVSSVCDSSLPLVDDGVTKNLRPFANNGGCW